MKRWRRFGNRSIEQLKLKRKDEKGLQKIQSEMESVERVEMLGTALYFSIETIVWYSRSLQLTINSGYTTTQIFYEQFVGTLLYKYGKSGVVVCTMFIVGI